MIANLSLYKNVPHPQTIQQIILDDHISSLRKLLLTRPTGILLVGTHQARNCLVDAVLPEVQRFSCGLYPIRAAPKLPSSQPICLDDVDTPCDRGEVEAALKGIFTRAQNVPIIGLADSEHHISKSLLRVGRFEKLLTITTAPPDARKRAWKRFLLSLVAEDPRFQFPIDADQILAAKSPGFDLSDFSRVIHAFFASSPHTATAEQSRFSFDILCNMVASYSPTQASTDLMFISTSLTTQEHSAADWASHAGYAAVKKQLMRLCEWPFVHQQTFKRLGVRPPRGVLLYGPHGVGKTLLAESLLRRLTSVNSIRISATEVFSKYLGESEARVRRLFARARMLSPCVVFIDDIDAVGKRGDEESSGVEGRVVASLLTELDGVHGEDVFVLTCATDLMSLDPAMVRPGRIDNTIKLELPDKENRKCILEMVLKDIAVNYAEGESSLIEWLVDETEGMTGADLVSLCDEAGMIAIEEEETGSEYVCEKHFREAMAQNDRKRTFPNAIATG
ncbi:AAA+ ATPase [Gracilaria domingensis]|nr:AAA+ ATPase [Gracilaria domingensis]